MTGVEQVRAFVDAFNARDLDAFVATLHPDVEIHASRGRRRGRAQAREWATRPAGGLQQRILVEGLRRHGDRVLALIVREWWWDEAGAEDVAGADEMAWLFEVRDGLIASWRPFDDRAAAFDALLGD